MYDKGQGVKQDYKKAFELYEKAANQGFAQAQLNVGTMYENAEGVKEDKKKAKEWYKKACDNRIQEGCEYYKDLNQKGY